MRFAALLTVLVALLLSAPWLLLALEAPAWAPAAIDVAVLCALAIAIGVRWSLGRAKGRTAAAAPRPPIAPARPDEVAELDEIRRELDTALGGPPRTRLGSNGPLRSLPWILLVGAEGSGKSTLVRASGLTFPSPPNAARDGSARGLGSTKRCDVWLGNEAVLFDTAGRWATADDDARWGTFLERLQAHRRDRALDAILLTVAIDTLLGATEVERTALARRVRARIEAVAARLETAVPVYLVVTRCDRLVGFSESFASLDKRERARPWGFALDGAAGAALEDRVQVELAALTRHLRARVMATLANERRAAARPLAVELAAHFELAHEPLATLLAQIFVASVYTETPALRGVYFTSATQEGAPVDALLAPSLRSAGIEPRPLAEPALDARSFFVHHVLSRVVVPDARAGGPSSRLERRRAWLQVAGGAALTAAAGVLVLASALSWRANRRAIDGVAAGVRALPRGAALATPESVDELVSTVVALDRAVDEGPPATERIGLWNGPRLREIARARLLAAMRDRVLAPLLAGEAEELASWGGAFEGDLDLEPDAADATRATALLERQLRFASPADPHEPRLDDRARARLTASLAEGWCDAARRPAARCARAAALLFDATSDVDRPRLARHDDAIRLARLGLARIRPERAALDALVADASARGLDLTLARMIGATGRALTADRVVRGAFTRRGWDEVVHARLDAPDDDLERAWRLGVPPSPRSAHALRRAYFEAYAEEWRAFLASVRIAPATDATGALALLEDLTRGTPPPIGRLLSVVDENADLAPEGHVPAGEPSLLGSLTTHLTDLRPELAQPAVPTSAAPSETFVSATLAPYTRFAVRTDGMPEDAPLGVDVYGDELELLRDALATYRDDETTAAALDARLVSARRRVDGLVAEQSPGARDFFERVLRPPVEMASVTSSRAMAAAVGAAFCAAVVAPFSASLSGRYPFAAQGDDAPLDEVAQFYRPGGTLWSHYDAALVAIAPRAGSRFTLAPRLDRSGTAPYGPRLPAFLERSQTITNGLFPPGSREPRIEIDVRIHPTPGAASVRLSVGGTTVDYRNGPETWTRLVWPGETPTEGAELEVQSARGLSERITQGGEWGLFRLVEAAAQIDARPGERTRTARWHLPGHDVDVVVDLRPVRSECPLFGEGHARALSAFRASGVSAPRQITRAGGECAP